MLSTATRAASSLPTLGLEARTAAPARSSTSSRARRYAHEDPAHAAGGGSVRGHPLGALRRGRGPRRDRRSRIGPAGARRGHAHRARGMASLAARLRSLPGGGLRAAARPGATVGAAGAYRAAMVRRDATDDRDPRGPKPAGARRSRSAGASPAPASAEAPGSRPHVAPGDRAAQAGRQKPVSRREPISGGQARGPQHEVKPAASTDK